MQKATEELLHASETIIRRIIDDDEYREKTLHLMKRKVAKEQNVSCPSKVILRQKYLELLEAGEIDPNEKLEKLLLKSAIRTSSGVAPIAIVTKPFGCPARCVYCPTEVQMPKSYNSNEPAIMRAIHNAFNAGKQVYSRLAMLKSGGHSTDKVEIIVLGGTFSAIPHRYVTDYFRSFFHALNGGTHFGSLKELQKENETATHRCVGITIETRPDWIDEAEIIRLRELGVTRVEIGVQHLDDNVQRLTRRNHYIDDVKRATYLLKEAGFKVCYHMMPNLPGSSPERDVSMFKELFEDPDLRPDQLKVYPCVVTYDAALKDWYEAGEYEPYDTTTLLSVLTKLKDYIPTYCRIIRLGRDIPAPNIIAGCKNSNLRQLVHEELKKQDKACKCIRCREVRMKPTHIGDIELVSKRYEASEGIEYFLSFESRDRTKLYAHLRLRIPSATLNKSKPLLPELESASIIREVHTYGQAVPVDDHKTEAAQHVGFGKKLILEAERLSQEHGVDKIAVISGIGVREYYRKRGYRLEGTYMVKKVQV